MFRYPDFVCLCAVYNHPQEWTENLIQSFIDQDYNGHADLILIDDRPEGYGSGASYELMTPHPSRNVINMYTPRRFSTLMDKYNFGFISSLSTKPAEQFFCVMDDDDVYLPRFLTSHAEAMGDSDLWSYPERVASTAGNSVRIEDSLGRFWASAAYRADAILRIGGFKPVAEAAFDQMFLAKMQSHYGPPARPKSIEYIYNTDLDIDHVSTYMSGQASTEWYGKTPPSKYEGDYTPKYHERAAFFKTYYESWVRGRSK